MYPQNRRRICQRISTDIGIRWEECSIEEGKETKNMGYYISSPESAKSHETKKTESQSKPAGSAGKLLPMLASAFLRRCWSSEDVFLKCEVSDVFWKTNAPKIIITPEPFFSRSDGNFWHEVQNNVSCDLFVWTLGISILSHDISRNWLLSIIKFPTHFMFDV